MKLRILSLILVVQFGMWLKEVRANELPEILQKVLKADTAYQSISCRIEIELDVPGLSMPEKEIGLSLEKGKKPRIESDGITILPRHGIIGQYREFLDLECQVIPIRENGDTLVYKVVSLERRSDWVTVDLVVTGSDAKIHSMLVATRKNGEYLIHHMYGDEAFIFPERTEISFEAMPLKLPLKFMGRQEGVEFLTEDRGPVTGKVILRYSDISWTLSAE